MKKELSNLPEQTPEWVGVPELEKDTIARAGLSGPMNAQALALMKRQKYLKEVTDSSVTQIGTVAELVARKSNLLSNVVSVSGFFDAGDGTGWRTI